jgi:manganese/zinc/iron transport system substrate-binding protein
MFTSKSRLIKSVALSLFLCAILAQIVTLSGCKKEEAEKDGSASTSGKYTIVTTCGMVTDIVKVVAGDKATVTGLIPAGDDPHMFRTGRKDVQRLIEADIVFYSGLLLEGRMEDDFETVKKKGKPVFAVTKNIKEDYLRVPPEFEGHPDPHVWMDIQAWSTAVGFVADALAEFDKENADYYKQNASLYRAQLDELDGYAKKVIATIPEEQRYLVTAHDAFGYFARAYGIEVKAVQGISTTSEAGIKDQNLLVDFVVAKKVPSIFVESSVSSENIKSVVNGCKDKRHDVKIGGELFSDAMGTAGTYEGTYIGMMDHNATKIAIALGGEAPEGGFQGKLAATKSE